MTGRDTLGMQYMRAHICNLTLLQLSSELNISWTRMLLLRRQRRARLVPARVRQRPLVVLADERQERRRVRVRKQI